MVRFLFPVHPVDPARAGRGELEELDPYEDVRETDLWVEVSADGLRVELERYEVVLPGPAAPLGG